MSKFLERHFLRWYDIAAVAMCGIIVLTFFFNGQKAAAFHLIVWSFGFYAFGYVRALRWAVRYLKHAGQDVEGPTKYALVRLAEEVRKIR
jgi:hypothetical protein